MGMQEYYSYVALGILIFWYVYNRIIEIRAIKSNRFISPIHVLEWLLFIVAFFLTSQVWVRIGVALLVLSHIGFAWRFYSHKFPR
ncbi:MAG: hypothetical protein KDC26_04470 [Armatimonadetes bacterium]|nr:hypothetical protein [Armatimonadota bacterium]